MYGLVEAWNWFWGLGIDLVYVGKVLTQRKRRRKPRNLGLRRCAAAQLFLAAAGEFLSDGCRGTRMWCRGTRQIFRVLFWAILGLCSGGSGDVSGMLF